MDQNKVNEELTQVLMDLTRCEHGRGPLDPCYGCPGGQSAGNKLLPQGAVIGHGVRGPIYMPAPEDRGNPKAWRTPPAGS
jgi:hypothetical protein